MKTPAPALPRRSRPRMSAKLPPRPITWEIEVIEHEALWRLDQAARAEVEARPTRWPAGAAIFSSVDGIALGAAHARQAMDELADTESDDYTQVQAIVTVVGLMGFTLATFDMLSGRYQADYARRAAEHVGRLAISRPIQSMLDRVLIERDAEQLAHDELLATRVPAPFACWYDLEAAFLAGYSLCSYRAAADFDPSIEEY